MAGVTVLSVSTRALLRACERLGLDTAAILESAGLRQADIDDPDARIPADRFDRVWREAHARAGDPELALHAAEAVPPGGYKVIDFLATSAATLGAGIRRVAEVFPIVDPRVAIDIDDLGDVVRFSLRIAAGSGVPPPPRQTYILAAFVLRTRAATGLAWAPAAVELAFPAPPGYREYERVFAAPVRFDRPQACMLVARSLWDTPVTSANPVLYELLRDYAHRLLHELPRPPSLREQVAEAIRAELRVGPATLEQVARRLGVGARTLQRRLDDDATSFAEVLDAVRARLAQEYLRDREVSIHEVGYLLGFVEQSSFTRAFKRWTGSTPGLWRRSVGA